MAKEYTPYKMKGHALPGIKQNPASPFQDRSGDKHKHPHVTTTYSKDGGKLSMTKTKGDKSSTYTETKSTKTKGGRTVELTNEEGTTVKRVLKGASQMDKDKANVNKEGGYGTMDESPAKIAPLVAMAGKAIIGSAISKAMDKDKDNN